MTLSADDQTTAIEQHIAEIRARAIVLQERHVAATAEMLRYAPKPGAQPTRRARFMFAKYAAETAAFLAVLDS
jgi:hypothetical protein